MSDVSCRSSHLIDMKGETADSAILPMAIVYRKYPLRQFSLILNLHMILGDESCVFPCLPKPTRRITYPWSKYPLSRWVPTQRMSTYSIYE